MTKIYPVGKYKESKKLFIREITPDQLGMAFALSYKKLIVDEENDDLDIIIFANGNRVKDVSKDNLHPYQERDYVSKIYNYFKNKNRNIMIFHILLDPDISLNIDSKIFAHYIDFLASKSNVKTINLIGHSKCGPVFFNMPKYFKNPTSFEKTSLVTTASPFAGCLIATPNLFFKEVRTVIDNTLPAPLNNLVFNALSKYYNGTSSNSRMDNDIALPGFESDKYDPDFIKKLFDLENINAVKQLRYYHNFTTGVDDTSLMKSLKRGDFTSVGLCLMDRFFMSELTDGFIEVSSQEKVNEHLDHPSSKVKSATHYFLSHEDELAIILDYINNKLDELEEQKRYSKK